MVQTRSWIGVTTLLWLSSAASAASTFGKDKRDDCHTIVDECTNKKIWAECSHSCTIILEQVGSMSKSTNEDFFELEFTTHQGKTFDLEDYQGYVTVFAVVPLMHGMSQYFYDLIDHVQNVYPYTIQTIVMPLKDNAADDVHIVHNQKSKVTLLEETDMFTHQLDYFVSTNRHFAGSKTTGVATDRVTIFIVSTSGLLMEKMISPLLSRLERRIQMFLMELNKDFDEEMKSARSEEM
jgi:hypothetical protein